MQDILCELGAGKHSQYVGCISLFFLSTTSTLDQVTFVSFFVVDVVFLKENSAF